MGPPEHHVAAKPVDSTPKPWYKRPAILAGAGAALVAVVLIIALPSALVTRHHGSGDSSGSSGSGSMAPTATATSTGTGVSSTFLPAPTGAGCGLSHTTGFSDNWDNHNIQSGGLTRNYSIYIPETYNDSNTKPWPLILDFHAFIRTGADEYNNSRYYNYTEGQQYLAVYPNGYDGRWYGAPYAHKDNDGDLQFVTDLLSHLNDTYCLDSNRMYVSGKSNGGGFADTLACSDHGDPFAAYAMASPALYTDNSESSCNKSRAILESHGAKDDTIAYNGGGSGDSKTPPIPEWTQWWAERNGCSSSDKPTTSQEKGYNTTAYSCNGFTNITEQYTVKDLGHCWPCSDGDNFDVQNYGSIKCADNSLDFTPVVLNWFGRWTKENGPKN